VKMARVAWPAFQREQGPAIWEMIHDLKLTTLPSRVFYPMIRTAFNPE